MNASSSTLLRALFGLGCAALLLTVVQACSGDETSSPTPPAGPAHIEITGISLGQGLYGEGGASSVLSCDHKIGVNVQLTNWTLLGPGRCAGALQCGQLRVTLVENGADVLQVIAAGNGVSLDGNAADPPVRAGGSYEVRAELIDDAGHPYIEIDGGNGTDTKPFTTADEPCTGGGAGGNGGTAGINGTAGMGQTAGSGGTAGGSETAGTGGTAGTGETAGTGGIAGTAGGSETAGGAGIGGAAGGAGIGGTAGVSGTVETAGTAGTTAGTAGGS